MSNICNKVFDLKRFLKFAGLGLILWHSPSKYQQSSSLPVPFSSLFSTWPSHFHLLLLKTVAVVSCPVVCNILSLEILLRQNTRMILLRQVVWKVASLRLSFSVILKHSDPYRRSLSVAFGCRCWISILVRACGQNWLLFLLRRDVMASSVPSWRLTILPKMPVNLSTNYSAWFLIEMNSLLGSLDITFDFPILILTLCCMWARVWSRGTAMSSALTCAR